MANGSTQNYHAMMNSVMLLLKAFLLLSETTNSIQLLRATKLFKLRDFRAMLRHLYASMKISKQLASSIRWDTPLEKPKILTRAFGGSYDNERKREAWMVVISFKTQV